MEKLNVNGTEVQVFKIEEDYISLTDMTRTIENGSVLIEKWIRNNILIPPNSGELEFSIRIYQANEFMALKML